MGVMEQVLNNGFSFNYYGINDLSTGWHLKTLIENEVSFKKYFKSKESNIMTIDDIRDYFVLNTVTEYQETVEHLKTESLKPILQSIVDFSIQRIKDYEDANGQMFELLNRDFKSILSLDDEEDLHRFEFVNRVLELAFNQYNRVKGDVFTFIETNHWSFIINNFEHCRGYYSKHISELDMMLGNIIHTEGVRPYSNLISFLKDFKSTAFNVVFKVHALSLANRALELSSNICDDNYLEVLSFLEDVYKLVVSYNLSAQLREFDKVMPVLKKKFDEISLEQRKLVRHEISMNDILQKLREDLFSKEIPVNIAFLQLTHKESTNPEDNRTLEPLVNSVFDYQRSTLIDSIRHVGLESNMLFPASLQLQFQLFFGYTDSLLESVIREKEISEWFFTSLEKVLELITDNYNLSHQDLSSELSGIIDSIIFLLSIDNSYPFYRTYCYGLSQVICAFVEKLLRKVYVEKCSNTMFYVPEFRLTLRNLLDDCTISNLLTAKLISIIKFELLYIKENSKGMENRVGRNLRNKLMHNYDFDYMNKANIALVVHSFHILLIIIHQLEVTVLKYSDD